jgi:hypothetical protein
MTDQEKKLNTTFQEFKVKGSQLVDKIRELMDEGSARHVTIKKDERVLLEFPLTIGAGGALAAVLLAPQLAAIGALAALVTDVSVIIEREKPLTELQAEILDTTYEPEEADTKE